jgi:hypothetical protein
MQYVIIIHKPNFFEVMATTGKKIGCKFSAEDFFIEWCGEALDSELYISPTLKPDNFARIHSPRSLDLEQYYDPEEINYVVDLLKDPIYFMASNLEFKSFEVLHQSLRIISEKTTAGECFIDNDFSTFLSVQDFVKKWDENPDWCWVNDFD